MARKGTKEAREYRKSRIRKKIQGTPERLRLSVYRGNCNIYTSVS